MAVRTPFYGYINRAALKLQRQQRIAEDEAAIRAFLERMAPYGDNSLTALYVETDEAERPELKRLLNDRAKVMKHAMDGGTIIVPSNKHIMRTTESLYELETLFDIYLTLVDERVPVIALAWKDEEAFSEKELRAQIIPSIIGDDGFLGAYDYNQLSLRRFFERQLESWRARLRD